MATSYDEEAAPLLCSSSGSPPHATLNEESPSQPPKESPVKPAARLSWMQWLKVAAKKLKHEVLALYYALHDPRTPWLAKLLAFLVLAYALSPLDLIPDFIPVLGILDDLLLLPGMIWLAIKLIPVEVMRQARDRAINEPLRLSRNWFVATLVFALWIACVEYGVHLAIGTWGNEDVKALEVHILIGVGVLGLVSFLIWLISALRKEKRKLAKAQLTSSKQVDEAEGLTEPLLESVV